MISYPDFRAAWRTHMADEGADALLRRFLILAARHGFPDARATALCIRIGAAREKLTVSLIRRTQALCILPQLSPLSILNGAIDLPNGFKSRDNGGCDPADAEWLTADLVREQNAIGANNPLFSAAYFLGAFCHIAPFDLGNLECAAALTTHFLLSRGAAPVLFFAEDRGALAQAAVAYRRDESLNPLLAALRTQVQKTAKALDLL